MFGTIFVGLSTDAASGIEGLHFTADSGILLELKNIELAIN
jgi:hypothetical protein